MKYQIKSISGHQTSKIFAIAFAVMTLPFAIIGIIGFFAAPGLEDQNGNEVSFPWLFLISMIIVC